MTPQEFDAWRERYDDMSYAEQMAFYEQVAAEHPVQRAWHRVSYAAYLRWAEPRHVLEFGGWRGELAAALLPEMPGVSTWINVEICTAVVAAPVCTDPRYSAYIPADWAWNVSLPSADAVVASHFIEHIRAAELSLLLDNLPATVRHLGLQSPLPEVGPTDWRGYHGSHILEEGWDGVVAQLRTRGWVEELNLRVGDFRAFERWA